MYKRTYTSIDRPVKVVEDSNEPSFAFEGVAVLGLDGGGDFAAQADGIDGAALAEALEYRHLRREHIAVVDGSQGAACFVIDTFGGVSDEDTRSVDHHRGCGFAPGSCRFLRSKQA